MKTNTIYTIGHSTHSLDDFLAMLKSFNIKIIVDIRRFPGSRKFPHFNKESLELSLQEAGIKCIYACFRRKKKSKKRFKKYSLKQCLF